jgi:GNAT superfamily N-acetyltransferase
MKAHNAVVLRSPGCEMEWAAVEKLIAELRTWDQNQSSALGFDPAEVRALFYPDGINEIRRDCVPPAGRLVLSIDAGKPAGVAAFRQLTAQTCELYNVYVRPANRGRGIGSLLLHALLNEARAAGYHSMCLETATFMRDAHGLYRRLEFQAREPYRTVPEKFIPVTMWLECRWMPTRQERSEDDRHQG